MPESDDSVVFVDADDTLWENNRWFTDVIDRWVELLMGLGVDGGAALLTLHEEEDRNIPYHGYGARPFVVSLRSAFARLVPEPTADARLAVNAFAVEAENDIRGHPIDLLPGVVLGLTEMRRADLRLVLLTKGQADEQTAKFERSGLSEFFESVRVVDEKDVVTYVAAARVVGVDAARCWMVGNSPRSDVNPAREAGMRTVHIPHQAPWHRELAPLATVGPPTLVVRTFAEVPRAILGR